MFRKTTPNPAVRFPSPEPKPLPRSEGKELMYRVLTRINSLDDSDLDPWEVALKSLRRMTMLRCFGWCDTPRDHRAIPEHQDLPDLHEKLEREMFVWSKIALFENAHAESTQNRYADTVTPDTDFDSLERA
jgi:hypothetical protein